MPMLVSLGEAPEYPDEHDPPRCAPGAGLLLLAGRPAECLHDLRSRAAWPRSAACSRAACAASRCRTARSARASAPTSCTSASLAQAGRRWDYMKELILDEAAVKESREMLVKYRAPPSCTSWRARTGCSRCTATAPQAAHLTPQEIRPLLERHYSVERCKEMKWFCDRDASEDEAPPKKTAYMRGTGRTSSTETFSIVAVTCALGRQLLLEHDKA